jgi:DNA-entry nuclease
MKMKRKIRTDKRKTGLLCAILMLALIFMSSCEFIEPGETPLSEEDIQEFVSLEKGDTDRPYAVVSGNMPGFTEEELAAATTSYEEYGKLDEFNRCTEVMASLSGDTMPQEGEERGNIGSIHPSGWHSGQGWERLHLIAWSLAAENDNDRNLVTGTHYCNVSGMLPFELRIARYIDETGNHVLYRVQPVFEGDDLICRGIHMEARSVEDRGKGICFNIYCFNIQPGKTIDYSSGYISEGEEKDSTADTSGFKYVINKSSKKFHYPECEGAERTSEKNREYSSKSRNELINEGYEPCGSCKP